MQNLGYYNGAIGPIEEIQVPMLDRGCYFGDGVYDATMCAHHTIFALEEHIDRFYRSAAMFSIDIPIEKDVLAKLLRDLVKRVDAPSQFVYWQVTRGTASRMHSFPNGKANLWIMLEPYELEDVYKPVKLLVLEDTRFLHCNAKTLNLLPSVVAAQKAKEAGCDEVVLHRNGRVTEGAHSNIHILKDGCFITAPTDNLILPGIARAHLITACNKLGIPVEERPYSLDELGEADEVLVSNCSALCLFANEVDGRPAGGKASELLQRIQNEVLAEYRLATQKT